MRPQPWTGLGIIVKEELGGVFCTLGYIILQDSLFLGDLANLIFQNQVLKCFPCSPDDGDYRPPILVKFFSKSILSNLSSGPESWVSILYPRVQYVVVFATRWRLGIALFCLS
jgi:hypothetical protein